jgi:hypothetical protein
LGIAKIADQPYSDGTYKGTINYLAPELLTNWNNFDNKVDIWYEIDDLNFNQ